MEVPAADSSASFSDIDEISWNLKSESKFFMGIKSAIVALKNLNDFLIGADAKSVERLMTEFLGSLLEQTDAPDIEGFAEEDCLLELSKVLQERRIIVFLERASRRFAKSIERRRKASNGEASKTVTVTVSRTDQMLFNSFVEAYIDSEARHVVSLLMSGEYVHLIVGPSGIGKTTLAWKAYDNETVRFQFDCCCWINVSGLDDLEAILKVVMKQMTQEGLCDEGLGENGAVMLIQSLRRSLQQKTYMFVFDDVCYEEFWDVIKALPRNYGSRVIVTTTSNQVAESCNQSFSYRVNKLGPVSDAKAWFLFSRIAFQNDPSKSCPTELKQLSNAILEMCRGFPLPIVGIAGLLSNKEKLVSEWQKVDYNFKRQLETNFNYPNSIAILNLPHYLRACFLYFSLFPKDSLIPTNKLFMLWIAEGFVESKIGKSSEEVAEEYLNELIVRDLVRPCQAFHEFGRLCKVDVLMHSTVQVKADELDFCQVWDGIDSIRKRGSHRLLIRNDAYVLLDNIDSRIRSVFLSGVALPQFLIRDLINKCAFLTMLDFEDCPIEHLPEELSKLSHLKYLCLRNTKVYKFPKSIQKLQKLQTLDCRNTLVTELPVGINKLKNLRHLLASHFENKGVRMKQGFGELVNLQTLLTIEAHLGMFEELLKLKELRQLGISGLTTEAVVALCTCINEFSHLESLTLQAMTNNEVLDLRTISPSPPRLKSLVLKGLLPKLLHWMFPLQNLNVLCLSLSRLTHDPMKHISHLPNLEFLWLYGAYEGEELYFEEGSFKKLKLLVTRELLGLNVLDIEDGALPLLEELRIGSSPLLNEVPIGITQLRNLKVLANYDMPKEFVVSMQPNGGSEFWKVEHIASVVFLYKVQGQDYQLFKLGDSELLDYLLGLAINRANIVQHPHEHGLSFSENDYEEDDVVGRLSFSGDPLTIPPKDSKRRSFSSSFYTDDLEE